MIQRLHLTQPHHTMGTDLRKNESLALRSRGCDFHFWFPWSQVSTSIGSTMEGWKIITQKIVQPRVPFKRLGSKCLDRTEVGEKCPNVPHFSQQVPISECFVLAEDFPSHFWGLRWSSHVAKAALFRGRTGTKNMWKFWILTAKRKPVRRKTNFSKSSIWVSYRTVFAARSLQSCHCFIQPNCSRVLSDFVARGPTDRRPTGCQCEILAPKLHMGECSPSNKMFKFKVQNHNPPPMFRGDTNALYVACVCSKSVDIRAEEWHNKYHLDFQPLRWSAVIRIETEGRWSNKFC